MTVEALVSADDLAALDELGGEGTWTVDGVDLHVTNLDKELFASDEDRGPATKRDLLRYLAVASPYLLPYLRNRPCNLHRFPNGTDAKGFWAKAAPKNAPDWLTTWRDVDAAADKTQHYVVVDRPATLLFLGNLAALEFHPWTSSCDRPDEPDWALIDIDPGTTTTFDEVRLLARLHREALDRLELQAGAKVTGQRGIQIWIPIRSGYTFEDTQTWVSQLSKVVGGVVPELVSWKWAVAERGGKARLDFTQNAQSHTLVAPFSPRARSAGPVSMPIEWDELDDDDLDPGAWTVHSAPERLAAVGDPMAHLLGMEQDLPALS